MQNFVLRDIHVGEYSVFLATSWGTAIPVATLRTVTSLAEFIFCTVCYNNRENVRPFKMLSR